MVTFRRVIVAGVVVAAASGHWACGENTPSLDTDAGASGGVDARADAPGGEDATVSTDASDASPAVDGGEDGGTTDAVADAGPPPDPTICDELGLPAQVFDEADGGVLFGDRAGDFTVQLLGGETWNLEAEWTGCESYVFLNYIPTTGDAEDLMWSSDVRSLLTEAPLNAHFFFTSIERNDPARRQRVEAIRDRIVAEAESVISDAEARAKNLARFHYVLDDATEIRGSVGPFLSDYLAYLPNSFVPIGGGRPDQPAMIPFVFAIDRHQRWDAGGSLFPIVGARIPTLDMASYLPMFYNHRAAIRDRVAAEEGLTSIVILDDRVTDRIFEVDAELPDAAAMAAFDTLELDVRVNCPFRNQFSCSEWDRNARIEVCPSGTCSCPPQTPECSNADLRREVVRWITPYWRRGWRRWIMDASDVLPLLGDGGTTKFRIVMGPSWERPTERDVRVAVRLFDGGKAERSAGAELAFRGGRFDEGYNDRDPVRFTPPASAERVELVALISGHGQADGTRCAEWCQHNHTFAVNGTPLETISPAPGISSFRGCARRADDGVPPGQGGNWAPQRAYWCPGLPVDRHVIDITEGVTLGEENEVSYAADYRGGAPGGGNIDLSVYVVWYESSN